MNIFHKIIDVRNTQDAPISINTLLLGVSIGACAQVCASNWLMFFRGYVYGVEFIFIYLVFVLYLTYKTKLELIQGADWE